MTQKFGGAWTLIKLKVLSKYLNFYTTALKNQFFNLCYIDAFAGCGEVNIQGSGMPGSALLALDYDFDKFIFIENDPKYVELLQQRICEHPSGGKANIYQDDCNDRLKSICSSTWLRNNWRGLIFLDPYALQVKWQSLGEIAKTKIFDVWYLFPLMALNRLLRRDKKISESHRSIINNVLGTDDWEKEIYRLSPQLTFWGEEYEKKSIEAMKQYILKRLQSVFPFVSPHALTLRSERTNTPLFLLCFATSNPSPAAIKLARKGANDILTHT